MLVAENVVRQAQFWALSPLNLFLRTFLKVGVAIFLAGSPQFVHYSGMNKSDKCFRLHHLG